MEVTGWTLFSFFFLWGLWEWSKKKKGKDVAPPHNGASFWSSKFNVVLFTIIAITILVGVGFVAYAVVF